jgi:hypothetical protein
MMSMRERPRDKTIAATLMPGDLVQVRSEAEILLTLDEKGRLESLPFMPEMLKFCGQRFRISRRALKTCVDDQDVRQLDSTVFLEEVRCDGSNHGGCGRACLIFWKEAWLKPVGGSLSQNGFHTPRVTQSDLVSLAMRNGEFFCQSSEIVQASKPLPWWQVKQYLWDVKYNQISYRDFLHSLFIAVYNKVAHHGRFRSWGLITGNGDTAASAQPLNLNPGELVRVKSLAEIRRTLDPAGKNRSLLFAPSMKDFCGQVLRVRDRVENIVLEGTSRQRTLTDTVLLEGATCDGLCHRMCPRQSFLFWRECWLERA